MDNLVVNNIQKACFHDGPGIRTTIFLNSCLLKCPWCANPETSKYFSNYAVNDKCDNDKCPYGIDCNGIKSSDEILKINYKKCPIGAIENIKHKYSIDELCNIIKDESFLYGDNGGVTFSGGEPLLQSKNLCILMNNLVKLNINIALETCLFANKSMLENVIDYVDLFIIDVKVLNEEECLKIIGGNINLFFENVKLIFSKQKKVIFRIPLISPYITNRENMELIYNFLNNYKPLKVELFKGHNLAKEKYLKLGLDYEEVKTIQDDEVCYIKSKIEDLKIKTEVIKF